jgi:hypothetical protein
VDAAICILDEAMSHADCSRFILELGPNLPMRVRGEDVSVKKRLNDLMEITHLLPGHVLDSGELLCDAIVEKAVPLLPAPRESMPWETPEPVPAFVEAFQTALEGDGFKVHDGHLQRTVPAEFQLGEAEDELTALLKKHGLTVAKGHLDQSLDANTRGNWAGANAQLRAFFDALLDEIAARVDPAAAALASGQPRRTKLASVGFLYRELNEWDDEGRGFINGLVKRLHPHGAHPGLSDKEDSTFRLYIVLLTARLLMVRFDKGPPL